MSNFSAAEQEAMRIRAEELRAEKGGKKKAQWLDALRETIAAMPEDDKAIAAGIHEIVTQIAPDLTPRTWYGFPAYERDGQVLVFVQPRSKFGVRYATLGFQDNAHLDDGDMWPTSYAITELTEEVKDRVRKLIRTAVSAPAQAE